MDISRAADDLIERLLEGTQPVRALDGQFYQVGPNGRFKDAEGTWYILGKKKEPVPVKNFAGTPHQVDKANRYLQELITIIQQHHFDNRKEVVRTKNRYMQVAPDKLRNVVVRALEKLPEKDFAYLASRHRVEAGPRAIPAIANLILNMAHRKLRLKRSAW